MRHAVAKRVGMFWSGLVPLGEARADDVVELVGDGAQVAERGRSAGRGTPAAPAYALGTARSIHCSALAINRAGSGSSAFRSSEA